MPLLLREGTPDVLQIDWRFATSADQVWAYLIDPTAMPTWLGQPLVWDLRVGGRVVVDHGDGYTCDSRVTEIVADSHLAITWKFADEPETLVNFDIRPVETGSVLRITHRGLGGLIDSYATGWLVHLTYLEGACSGAPLPISQFWNLHETLLQSAGASR